MDQVFRPSRLLRWPKTLRVRPGRQAGGNSDAARDDSFHSVTAIGGGGRGDRSGLLQGDVRADAHSRRRPAARNRSDHDVDSETDERNVFARRGPNVGLFHGDERTDGTPPLGTHFNPGRFDGSDTDFVLGVIQQTSIA